MPVGRVPGQSFDALVDHVDGRQGRLRLRGPPLEAFPVQLGVAALSSETKIEGSDFAHGGRHTCG